MDWINGAHDKGELLNLVNRLSLWKKYFRKTYKYIARKYKSGSEIKRAEKYGLG
jgi:hypothetical protein